MGPMNEPAEKLRMTREEYLAYERACIGEKHEYVDGEIFAMSGGTFEHAMIAGNVLTELQNALRAGPCRAIGSDMRIGAADGSYHYPDVSVVCDRPQFEDDTRDVLQNPSVIIEVLSESTEAYDRGEKFAHYRSIGSLRDYILVSQTTQLIEHYQRISENDGAAWRYRVLGPRDTLRLEDHDVAIPVERVYARMFPEG